MIEISDTSKQLVSDSQQLNDLCELNIEATLSHVKAHLFLSDHSFNSNSVIKNVWFHLASKSRFFHFFMTVALNVFGSTDFNVRCFKVGA